MTLKLRATVVLCAMLLCYLDAGAQSIPINPKFGVISDEELKMAEYPQDTSAAVLILYRKIDVDATITNVMGFTRRVTHTERFKVLKESGKKHGDYKIYYSIATDPRESVSNIKVVTYNIDNGKKVVDKLPRKLIFDEEVSEKRRAVSFSAQNVRVGSVVEVSFTYTSPRVANIGTLYLQTSYPINLSEVIFSYCDYFKFNRIMRGYVPSMTTESSTPGRVSFDNGGSLEFNTITDTHRAVDVPAYKPSPHCYCPDLYRLGCTYDLRLINIANQYFKDYSTTWEQVDEELQANGFIKEFHAKSRFAEQAAQAKASSEDEAAQVVAIRNAVLDKVHWNDYLNILPESAKAYKAQEGDSADINALVASALNDAGFKAEPIFVKTRDRGLLLDYHVSSDDYNAVVLEVIAPSGKIWYMEAADKNSYLNVLPTNYLVSKARLVPLKGPGHWVDLSQLSRNQLIDSVKMEVAADGSINGTRSQHCYNNWAATLKSAWHSFDDDEKFAEDIEGDDQIEIEDMNFQGADQWSPDAVLDYSFCSQASKSGDLIYVRPFLSKYHEESDFREPERMIPVEFPYPESIVYTAFIFIPEGYTVESIPQTVSLNCAVLGSRTIAQCQFDGDRTISFNYRFTRNGCNLLADQYKDLRDYWAHLCSLYSSTIVLKKK